LNFTLDFPALASPAAASWCGPWPSSSEIARRLAGRASAMPCSFMRSGRVWASSAKRWPVSRMPSLVERMRSLVLLSRVSLMEPMASFTPSMRSLKGLNFTLDFPALALDSSASSRFGLDASSSPIPSRLAGTAPSAFWVVCRTLGKVWESSTIFWPVSFMLSEAVCTSCLVLLSRVSVMELMASFTPSMRSLKGLNFALAVFALPLVDTSCLGPYAASCPISMKLAGPARP